MKQENLDKTLNTDLDFKGIFDKPKNQQNRSLIRDTKRMNDKLTKPVQEEATELDHIEQNNKEVDKVYQTQIDKKWTWCEKMTNRSMYNQVVAVKSELVKQSGHYRLAFYRTILDSRLEALNEKCNAGLKMIKAHYRKDVASFLMAKMEEMSIEVRDRQFNFLEMMKGKYAYADGITDYPSMHERYMEQIWTEEGRYLAFLDAQLVKFESIVNEEIRKYH